MKYRKGLTLIELLVGLTILALVLMATFFIYRSQLRTASTQRSVSYAQTDVQQALNIFKWDALMAGYGVPSTYQVVQGVNFNNRADSIILRSTGFVAGGTTRWSYTLDIFSNDEIIVRRWNDEREDIHVGDYIVILDDRRTPITPQPLQVTGRVPLTYNGMPAYRLTLSSTVNTRQGNFVYVVPNGQFQEVSYRLVGDTLMRGNDVLLKGVEDLQFSYWVDLNNDRVEQPNERIQNPQAVPNFSSGLRSVRVNLVVLTSPDPNYRYPENTITVEDHTYNVSPNTRNMRRRFYTLDIKVRNIK